MPKRLTTKQFIYRAQKVHGSFYDYSLVNYNNNRNKVKIICKKHGMFEQSPESHLSKNGCPKCYYDKRKEELSHTTEQFIQRAKLVHGDTYNYCKVNYVNAKTKVIITCPIHGDFEQVPDSHLRSRGCPNCVDKGGWKTSDWKKSAEKSKNFDSFKVYIVKCWNKEEEFYKIGKTYLALKNRFSGNRDMPYNYKIIKIIKGEYKEISILEKQLQKENKKHKYIPKIEFNGYTECFNKLK